MREEQTQLNDNQGKVLAFLGNNGESTVLEISRKMKLRHMSVLNALWKLKSLELVEKIEVKPSLFKYKKS